MKPGFFQKLSRVLFGGKAGSAPHIPASPSATPLVAGMTRISPRSRPFEKPSAIQLTGIDQLERLISTRVPFLLLDFRSEENQKPIGKTLVRPTTLSVTVDTVVDELKTAAMDSSHPIVLICETGKISLNAAQELERHNYINLVVVENGVG